MTDLTEFLLARIAEDAATATGAQKIAARWKEAVPPWVSARAIADQLHRPIDTLIAVFADPARVLADCAAKRQIVELYEHLAAEEARGGDVYSIGLVVDYLRGDVLPALASIWAEHSDFDESWRP